MTGKQWVFVSSQAKDLIQKMLRYNPSERFSAKQALDHEWFQLDKSQTEGFKLQRQNNIHVVGGQKNPKENQYRLSDQEIQNALANMKTFRVTQKLK